MPTAVPDPRNAQLPELANPARGAVAVTPNDSTDLSTPARALYVGIGGDLKVTTIYGQTVEFRNIPSGSVIPVMVSRVFATGQTSTIASAIVALY